MIEKRFVKSAYSQAFTAWFSEYERERRHQKKRKGARLVGFLGLMLASRAKDKAALIRLQAHMALCQVQIERNTRK